MAARKRWADGFHKYLANPAMRQLAGWLPGQALLETTGRRSGLSRRTPVGGRWQGDTFWMVSDHGPKAAYVQNLIAQPTVRLRSRGQWHAGSATVTVNIQPASSDTPLSSVAEERFP